MDRIKRTVSVLVVGGLAGCAGLTPTEAPSYSVTEGGALIVQPSRGVLAGYTGPGFASLIRGPEHASVFVLRRSGDFRYVHDGTETLSDAFTYTVQGDSKTYSRRATVAIVPVNDVPIVRDLRLEIPPGSTATGKLLIFDPDDATLKLTTESPNWGTVRLDPQTMEFTYKPREGYTGMDRFRVTVSDGHGIERTATVTINVTATPGQAEDTDFPTNRPPRISDLQLKTAEDRTVTGRFDATDPDGDPLSYSVGAPDHGLASINRLGVVEYGPEPDFNGSDRFTVEVTDDRGAGSTARVQVDVTPVNDPPVVENSTIQVAPGEAVQALFQARDPDGDELRFEIVDAGRLGEAELVATEADAGRFIYRAPEGATGSDRITFRVADGRVWSTEGEVSVRFQPQAGE